VATLQEIETHYTLNDLADAHEALDIADEAEEFYRKKSEAQQAKKK